MEDMNASAAACAGKPGIGETYQPDLSHANEQESSNTPSEFVDNEDSDDDELDAMMQDGELKDRPGPLSAKQSDKIGMSIYAEVKQAAWEARYLSVVLAVLSVIISYQLFIAPYPIMNKLERSLNVVSDFGLVRPVLTDHQQRVLQENARNGETNFVLPGTADHIAAQQSEIKIKFHAQARDGGVHKPPDMFYNGVMFGITDGNSHQLRYTHHKPESATVKDPETGRVLLNELSIEESLNTMRPKPTHILRRQVQNNATGWAEEGFGVYFSFDDLARQGKLSSDQLKPWKRVLEDIIAIARSHRQVYVTAWYPHTYGQPGDSTRDRERYQQDPHVFTSILQQVIPIRTGLNGIVSTVPVWMSAVNKAAPARKSDPRFVPEIRKEWTDEDHWTRYQVGSDKYVKYTEQQLKDMKYKLFDGIQGVEREPPNDMVPSQIEALAVQAVNEEAKKRYLALVGDGRQVLNKALSGGNTFHEESVDFDLRYSETGAGFGEGL